MRAPKRCRHGRTYPNFILTIVAGSFALGSLLKVEDFQIVSNLLLFATHATLCNLRMGLQKSSLVKISTILLWGSEESTDVFADRQKQAVVLYVLLRLCHDGRLGQASPSGPLIGPMVRCSIHFGKSAST